MSVCVCRCVCVCEGEGKGGRVPATSTLTGSLHPTFGSDAHLHL